MAHDAQGGCCGGSSARTQSCADEGASKKQAGGGCCGGSKRAPLQVLEKVEQFKELGAIPLIMRSRRGIEHIDRRVLSLTERQIDTAFLPDAGVGRWPVRVLIGHIADADLSFVHRMRRIIGEENPVFSEWDEDSFIDANIYGNVHEGYADNDDADHARVMNALGGHLAVIHTLRQWTGQWLLSLPASAFDRAGMHPSRGRQTLMDVMSYYTWHLEHHARFLNLKLDRMLGPAPVEEPEAAAAGCCGGGGAGGGCGCGCKN